MAGAGILDVIAPDAVPDGPDENIDDDVRITAVRGVVPKSCANAWWVNIIPRIVIHWKIQIYARRELIRLAPRSARKKYNVHGT